MEEPRFKNPHACETLPAHTARVARPLAASDAPIHQRNQRQTYLDVNCLLAASGAAWLAESCSTHGGLQRLDLWMRRWATPP